MQLQLLHSCSLCLGCDSVIPVVIGLTNDIVLIKQVVVVVPIPTAVVFIAVIVVVTDKELNASKISIKTKNAANQICMYVRIELVTHIIKYYLTDIHNGYIVIILYAQ